MPDRQFDCPFRQTDNLVRERKGLYFQSIKQPYCQTGRTTMFIICYPEQTDQRARSRLDWLALSSKSYFNPSDIHWVFFSQAFMNHCWCSNAPGFDSWSTKRLFSSPLFPWSSTRSPCNKRIVLCAENSQAVNSFLGVVSLWQFCSQLPSEQL